MARKKENKSAKIRALLDKGVSQKDIVKKLKVSAQLVYVVAKNHGALTDTQSSIAKKLGISVKKTSVKQKMPAGNEERIVLAKLWVILSEYYRTAQR